MTTRVWGKDFFSADYHCYGKEPADKEGRKAICNYWGLVPAKYLIDVNDDLKCGRCSHIDALLAKKET